MYPLPSRLLHWAAALAIVAAFALVWGHELVPRGPIASGMVTLHMWAGLLVFALLILRLAVRLLRPAPSLEEIARWQTIAARLVQATLYLAMAVQPPLGWFYQNLRGRDVPFFGWALPRLAEPDATLGKEVLEIHNFLGWAILVLAGLHAAAALYHHFFLRDRVLASMLGPAPPRNARAGF
jgi:superoxide oxidase